ncbi:conserved hypothetical protein [Talaromyces stipitatus ATCC 10500]|uniref:O-methyltransferase n=1 Tax=Talaromyces stipitatus (strain ATCC 10500 / CBS 375.48 / QM 6759 / NRRL 1006) TaxID=441959 RepID=B8MK29_TALSN|nr:uncharacterized protein TSTA_043210 [Talaromyces stipitatus ATCC 10500]EED14846.1 conserved hypothetical protein [Talaromyces stipitatus ATCC 10500]
MERSRFVQFYPVESPRRNYHLVEVKRGIPIYPFCLASVYLVYEANPLILVTNRFLDSCDGLSTIISVFIPKRNLIYLPDLPESWYTYLDAADPSKLDAIATKANDLARVPSLVEEIVFYAEFPEHEYHRRHLLRMARNLVQALETPQETPTLYGAILTAIDCGIFSYMSESPSDPVHADRLAQIPNTDPALIRQSTCLEPSCLHVTCGIMKHLAAMGVFHESGRCLHYYELGPDPCRHKGESSDEVDLQHSCLFSIPPVTTTQMMPLTGYFNSHSGLPNTGSHGHRTALSAYHQGRPSWMDYNFYPVQESLRGMQPDQDTVLLVDIGGGIPSRSTRIPKQDKADVVEQVSGDLEKIEVMAHDFFIEQRIKGSILSIYYNSYRYRMRICHWIYEVRPRLIMKTLLPSIAEYLIRKQRVGYQPACYGDLCRLAYFLHKSYDLLILTPRRGGNKGEKEDSCCYAGTAGYPLLKVNPDIRYYGLEYLE